VLRRLGAIDHERRVSRVAGTLFDLTAALHGLGPSDRRLLQLAAIVHDVGRSEGNAGHAVAGCRMLLDDAWLPLTAAERRVVGYLTLHHRGPVPDLGKDDVLADGDDRRAVRVLLALLRAADALDGRSIESPRLVFALRGRHLRVGVYLDEDSPKARKAYGKRKKLRLLEDLLDCRVEVEIRLAEALSLVT
jgi:exopolyphosphatase/guanosine-5'-triphosphate,3'-diphosphate pyrophosphatase